MTLASAPPRPAVTAAEPSRPPRSVERLRLAAVCLGLILVAFSQSSGQVATDTKLDLVADPGAFLGRALRIWDPTAYFGELQNQAYGYLFPMGPFFWVGHLAHLPPWVTQRAWYAALLVLAFLGARRALAALGVGTPLTRAVAAVGYALSPRMVTVLGPLSAEALPMAVAPWVLAPLVAGARGGSPRRAALRSGAALLLAGGVNAVATLAVLPLPAWWLLTRHRGRRRRALAGWWALAVAAACAWWAGPLLLLGRYSPPFLDWIESAATTTSVTTLLDTLRGTDDWVARAFGAGGPEWGAGWALVGSSGAVLATAALAAAGLAGLARRDTPHRLFLTGAVVAGLLLVTAGHTGAGTGLLAHPEQTLLDGVLAPLRNLHKFDPVLRLPLAAGLAHLLARARLPRLAMASWGRRLVVGAAVAGITVSATPALAGDLVSHARTGVVPGYWRQAAGWLADHQRGDGVAAPRALVVPGAMFATYLWGRTNDDAMQPLARAPWAVRDGEPLSSAGAMRVMDVIDERLAAGAGSPALAGFLARAGIGYLVVRNDLDWVAVGAPSPELVHQAVDASPGLRRVAAFGPDVGGEPSLRGFTVDAGAVGTYPAVEVYAVGGGTGSTVPQAVRRVGLGALLTVAGAPEAPLQLAEAGLAGDRPTVLAGDPTARGLPGTPVVTDTLRRREYPWGSLVTTPPATLAAADRFRLRRRVHDLLPDGGGPATAVRYAGLESVTASSSGSDADAWLNRSPAHQPWAALDGDPETTWRSGGLDGAVGQWLELRFTQQILPDHVQLAFSDGPGPLPVAVRVSTDAGSLVQSVSPDQLVQRVDLPPGPTASLRVTVQAVDGGGRGVAVGLRTLLVPGLFPNRTLRVPDPPAGAALSFRVAEGQRDACLTVSGHPYCAAGPDASGLAAAGEEDGALDRTFATAGPASYAVRGTVRPVPGSALRDLLARYRFGPAVLASSSVTADPRGDASAAADGSMDTAWLAKPGDTRPTLILGLPRPAVVRGVALRRAPWLVAARPRTVVVAAGGREVTSRVGADGVVPFPPTTASQVTIRFTDVDPLLSSDRDTLRRSVLPVGVSEAQVLGAPPNPRLPAAAAVALPCGSGPRLEVDGQAVPTQLTGTVGDLLALRPVRFAACAAGGALPLRGGEHRVRLPATDLTAPVSLTLVPPGWSPPPASRDAGRATVLTWGAEHRRLRVDPGRAATLLVVAENENPGWTARLAGRPLRAVRVDGWQQGWVVPAGVAGVVSLDFAPGRTYRLSLLLGAMLAAALVAAAWWPRRRQHPAPAAAADPMSLGSHPRHADAGRANLTKAEAGRPADVAAGPVGERPAGLAVAALAAVAILLLAGVAGLAASAVAGAACAALSRTRLRDRLPDPAPYLAAAVLLVVGIGAALRPVGGGGTPFAETLAAQLGCAAALGAALYPVLRVALTGPDAAATAGSAPPGPAPTGPPDA